MSLLHAIGLVGVQCQSVHVCLGESCSTWGA